MPLKRKSCKLKCKIIDCFRLKIFISVSAKPADEKKKSEENEQTESISAHHRSQPKWQLVQTNYLKRVKLLLFLPYNKHLINRAKSVCIWESWPRSCVQTSLRSICTYDLRQDSQLLYGSVSQGLGTTKFTNLIGWNGYWPRSRFSHLDRHLDRECFEAKKLQAKMQNYWLLSPKNIYFCNCQTADEKKKVKRTSKLWKN